MNRSWAAPCAGNPYETGEDGLLSSRYADVLGIPFHFNAEPTVAPPQKPRNTVWVHACVPRMIRGPSGSRAYPGTSKTDRYKTSPVQCHVDWVILDSGWESEFCRVAESHPQVLRYVKNHNLGLEVPYRLGGKRRIYRPDFIVVVDDGNGDDDPLHLVVEIKGYRGEDAQAKKDAMHTYWVPGINYLGR